jgi:glycosyltransferase involved in cell wall biosynthesis
MARNVTQGAEIGLPSREKLIDCYRTADPLRSGKVELEGMSVLEAMSAGLPAIIANAPESASSKLALNEDFASRPATRRRSLPRSTRSSMMAAREPYRQGAHQFDFAESVGKFVELYRSVIQAAASSPASLPETA